MISIVGYSIIVKEHQEAHSVFEVVTRECTQPLIRLLKDPNVSVDMPRPKEYHGILIYRTG